MHPGYSVKELAQATSKAWKEISESEKAKYEETAKTKRESYNKLFNAYKQTTNYAIHQKALKEHKVTSVKKTKFRKDENAPKKPLSAYFLWMADNREGLVNQGLAHKEILKKLGEMWKTVTDEQKKPYQDKAATAKKTYEVELAKYKNTDDYKTYQ